MTHSFIPYSLMLVGGILLTIAAALPAPSEIYSIVDRDLAVRENTTIPTTTVTPCIGSNCIVALPTSTNLPCATANGTELSIAGKTTWTMLCDIDFKAQDIYPFILSGSFESCLNHCNNYNANNDKTRCAGFVFAPDRIHLENDCYLKSSVNDPIYPATIHLLGATLKPTTPLSTAILVTSTITNKPAATQPVLHENVRTPSVGNSAYLGTSVNNPTKQYVKHSIDLPVKLATDLLIPGINVDLITGYDVASGTGTWTANELPFDRKLADMKLTPRLSRDGGKGGMVNGTHIFIFCDTSTYGDEETSYGYFNGFVSSTVAVDKDLNGRTGDALTLVDMIGGWQDDVGRMRGWAPMTAGENSFNLALSGDGYRYAVWPESSPITLNETHAIIYAPLVYVDVDMSTQAANFTTLGNTLLLVSVDPFYGPHADRISNQFFTQHEVTWGSLGGMRAWGPSGIGTMEGSVYLFGQVDNGVLVSRVAAQDFADRSKYEYWNGSSWSVNMPPPDALSEALMIDQPVMDFDIFYSPYHKTFIMVYLTPFADNTFYFRHLESTDGGTPESLPPYVEGGDLDYVEDIMKHTWSEQKILFVVPSPEEGYIYAGGVHAGYFGEDDITEGGIKLLCTWTEHTVTDPNKPESGYAHKAQWVELGW